MNEQDFKVSISEPYPAYVAEDNPKDSCWNCVFFSSMIAPTFHQYSCHYQQQRTLLTTEKCEHHNRFN